ncbi:MAG: PAS domain-containing protein [Clostridia bacterium]|nr:PAS domain-containing protein [Clostridia bacterium]
MKEDLRKRYTTLVGFLGKALGPHFEVVLHEVDTPEKGIVAIANGHVSGRSVGAPLTNTALRLLVEKEYEKTDCVINYDGVLGNGKPIRSSTFFIMDGEKPTGMLCINFDDSEFHEMAEHLMRLVHPDAFVERHRPMPAPALQAAFADVPEETEHFQNDSGALMEQLYRDAVKSLLLVPPFSGNDRALLIKRLQERGLFELKGSVPFAIEKLGCSQASIYRYLRRAKENN